MRVLLRLLTIPCNILELSILKFVIISFEIMLPKGTLILSMFVPISNWRIYSPNRLMRKYFAIWEVNWTSLMLQTWSRNSICIHARHEPSTNPWYFSYVDDHMSWIYLHLACCLTHVGTWLNLIPWDCDHSHLEQSLHHQDSTQWWLKTRKHKTIQTYEYHWSLKLGIEIPFGYMQGMSLCD